MTSPLHLVNSSKDALVRQWQATFNTLGVRYIAPAPAVRIDDDHRFRATFFLPGARQYVLVLPFFDSVDMAIHRRAIEALPRRIDPAKEVVADLPIVLALPAGVLRAWDRDALDAGPDLSPALHCCAECGRWYFCDDSQSWVCQICDFYDGSCTMRHCIGGNSSQQINPFPLLELPEHF